MTRIHSGSDLDSDWMHGWSGSDERPSQGDPHKQ